MIAIERLIDAQADTGEALLVLAGYTVIYCLPCLMLLVIGLLSRQRTRALLARITNRLGTGDVPGSPPAAIALMTLGLFVGTLPLWALS